MFNKISYLATVSIFSSVLMFSNANALHEEKLVEEITASLARLQDPKVETVHGAWQIAGNVARYVGQKARGDTDAGKLVTNNAYKAAAAVSGNVAGVILKEVKESESLWKSACKGFGNGLRTFGAWCKGGETPTLARDVREFWVTKYKIIDPEIALTSTACALFLTPELKVDSIIQYYKEFLIAWNSSSDTEPSLDDGTNLEYFVRGILRGLVKSNKVIPTRENVLVLLNGFEIKLADFSVTKMITAESVVPNAEERQGLTQAALAERVEEQRKAIFMDFVTATTKIELDKLEANNVRKALLSKDQQVEVAQVQDAPALLQIEGGQAAQDIKRVEEVE